MMNRKFKTWEDANQYYLVESLNNLKKDIACFKENQHDKSLLQRGKKSRTTDLEKFAAQMVPPPALETLGRVFRLSAFERHLLLTCAGLELDSEFAALFAKDQGNGNGGFPTFGFAISTFPDAHWSALSPDAPLRRWSLLEIGAGSVLTANPLRINERILHFLTGVKYIDYQLQGLLQAVTVDFELPASHNRILHDMLEYWRHPTNNKVFKVQFYGNDPSGMENIACKICERMDQQLFKFNVDHISSDISERMNLARLLEREIVLNNSVLFLEITEHCKVDKNTVLNFINSLYCRFFIAVQGPVPIINKGLIYKVVKPEAGEQQVIWRQSLQSFPDRMGDRLDEITAQFDLSAESIHAISHQMGFDYNAVTKSRVGKGKPNPEEGNDDAPGSITPDELFSMLWRTCRQYCQRKTDDMVQILEPSASLGDLVLPAPQKQILNDIIRHVRYRNLVYETWGFAAKSARGLGISALFTGPSGTGKTMTAEALANALQLSLYRIDLSAVVSKYIGETEKNLKRVFDAAEEGGAVLLFDEADALFGKRSEVKDSHDRYANIEISYLLQRMESFKGLAILTTNLKDALDTAFLRRIRFVVTFPFPDVELRKQIWQQIFPVAMPLRDLDFDKLAKLNVTGGSIRNIAMNAAFLAADDHHEINMQNILHAAKSEYAKLAKTLTNAETAGWI